MSRGRPKGSGKRWTDFADVQIWSHVEHIRRRDGIDVRAAANRLAHDGYFQLRDGKLWVTRPPKKGEKNEPLLIELARSSKAGDKRMFDPGEVFRTRYYAAARRQKNDPAFKSDCEFWLHVRAETDATDDPIKAFLLAFDSMLDVN